MSLGTLKDFNQRTRQHSSAGNKHAPTNQTVKVELQQNSSSRMISLLSLTLSIALAYVLTRNISRLIRRWTAKPESKRIHLTTDQTAQPQLSAEEIKRRNLAHAAKMLSNKKKEKEHERDPKKLRRGPRGSDTRLRVPAWESWRRYFF